MITPAPETEWHLAPGDVTTREVVAATYGGAKYGGIQPSRRTPNVILYSDLTQGRRHGYTYDGWSRTEPGVFYYTGEGQTGDQALTKGNKAILEAAETGRTLRLFEVDGPNRGGGKPQRYIGAFTLDQDAPYRREENTDRNGLIRTVLVFKLRTLEATDLNALSAHDGLAETPAATATTREVPCEVNANRTFVVSEKAAGEATRLEADLMRALENDLRRQGHDVARLRITPPGQTHDLVTDTYDKTAGVLYEAKATATRANVRMAIGQLLDYARYAPEGTKLAILLPQTPAEDLVDLITSCGMTLVLPASPH